MDEAEKKRIFEVLFKSHYEDLTRFVFGYVNDGEVAKDIVHDVFLVIWQRLEYLYAFDSMNYYLYILCRNRALDYLKHLRIVSENEQDIRDHLRTQAKEEVEQVDERIELVKKKLELLPTQQRETLKKHFLEGKKYEEVAEELGIALNSVKTHIQRGLKSLRSDLREDLILYFLLKG